jgi:hypothetical protein
MQFSIPTAQTIHLPDGWTLNKNTRGHGDSRSMMYLPYKQSEEAQARELQVDMFSEPDAT